MGITEEINKWIEEHGDTRTALCVAITRLEISEMQLDVWKDECRKAWRKLSEKDSDEK